MRKHITTIVSILFACLAHAQSLDSIAHHVIGYYGPTMGGQMDHVAQLSDGSVLFIHKVGINMNITSDVLGNNHYRMARHGGILLDTLFVFDWDPSFYLFAKNPNGNGNLRFGIVNDSACGKSFFQIFPMDDDLNYDSINEIRVPLADTFAYNKSDWFILDKEDNVVMLYGIESDNGGDELHIAYFGLDGTLRHESATPYFDSFPMREYFGFGIFNESPREYYLYGGNKDSDTTPEYVTCYVFDSLFQHKDTFSIRKNDPSSSYHFLYDFNWEPQLIPDGDDFIFACRYDRGAKNGVCMVRYDKQTLEHKNVVYFESKPMLNNTFVEPGACEVKLCRDDDGCFYFCYDTQCIMVTDKGNVAVAKVDADFKVLWQRFCLEPEGYYFHGSVMTVLDGGGVAVGGAYWYRRELFFLIINDDYDAIEEQGMAVRPYAYWPNPAHNQLHLQFSPDVTPKSIELYDLQGRIVRSQRNGLESLNLQGLSAGQYVMKVTLENGKVFSDKVVKE